MFSAIIPSCRQWCICSLKKNTRKVNVGGECVSTLSSLRVMFPHFFSKWNPATIESFQREVPGTLRGAVRIDIHRNVSFNVCLHFNKLRVDATTFLYGNLYLSESSIPFNYCETRTFHAKLLTKIYNSGKYDSMVASNMIKIGKRGGQERLLKMGKLTS